MTIYTDASFCAQTKAAGWACWVKTDGQQSRFYSGPIRRTVRSACEAEYCAAANAIFVAFRDMTFFPDVRRAIFVTDHQTLANDLNKVPRKSSVLTKIQTQCLAYIVHALVSRNWEWKANKVKAHSFNDGNRSALNADVDQAARAAMRRRRKVLRPSIPGLEDLEDEG